MLSQSYYVVIERGVIVPENGIDVVDGLNTTEKGFIFQLMATVQMTGSTRYDTHILMRSATSTADVNLAQELLKHLFNAARKHGVIDQVKYKTVKYTRLDRKGLSFV